MVLPDRCQYCTYYDEGRCCHPDPFPHIIIISEGAKCESFDINYDLDPLPVQGQRFMPTWCLNCGKHYTADVTTQSVVFCSDECFHEYHDLARDTSLDKVRQ